MIVYNTCNEREINDEYRHLHGNEGQQGSWIR
jgi:hypothetical protein